MIIESVFLACFSIFFSYLLKKIEGIEKEIERIDKKLDRINQLLPKRKDD